MVGNLNQREYPQLTHKNTKRKDALRRKTNEEVKGQLLVQAEMAIEGLLKELEEVKEGDEHHREHVVLPAVLELGRKGMETLLNDEAQEEAPLVDRKGECGHPRSLMNDRKRRVWSLMGHLRIPRAYDHCKKTRPSGEAEPTRPPCPGMVPFDQRWGLSQHQRSPGVQRLVARLSARLTHEEGAEAVSQVVPVTISARQVGQVLQPIGEAFLAREDHQVQQVWEQGAHQHLGEAQWQEEAGPRIPRLSVEMDGVMARLRRGSVSLEADECECQGDVYREVKVGAIFHGEPGRERSELVPGVCVDTPGPLRSVARRTTAEEGGPRRSALARQNGLLRAQQVVILGEGATWIGKLADEQFPGAVPIVDESHAREHVWDVARAAFALDIERRDSWAHRVIDLLSDGNVEEVIAAIETLPSLSPEPGKMKSVQETEAEYVRTNRQRMNSPVFRAQGMHLGSGIAEAACKTVVRTRATRSGMRWTPEGLAAILALRTAVLNKDFDQCWPECHKGAG